MRDPDDEMSSLVVSIAQEQQEARQQNAPKLHRTKHHGVASERCLVTFLNFVQSKSFLLMIGVVVFGLFLTGTVEVKMNVHGDYSDEDGGADIDPSPRSAGGMADEPESRSESITTRAKEVKKTETSTIASTIHEAGVSNALPGGDDSDYGFPDGPSTRSKSSSIPKHCVDPDDPSKCYHGVETIATTPFMQLDVWLDHTKSIMSVQFVVEGRGWVSVGLSKLGSMIGTIAVIGLPNEPVKPYVNPAKYMISERAANGIQKLQDEQQYTLWHADLIQNDTHTVLSFLRPFVDLTNKEEETLPMALDDGKMGLRFIYAHGVENELGYHSSSRGSVSFSFDGHAVAANTNTETEATESDTNTDTDTDTGIDTNTDTEESSDAGDLADPEWVPPEAINAEEVSKTPTSTESSAASSSAESAAIAAAGASESASTSSGLSAQELSDSLLPKGRKRILAEFSDTYISRIKRPRTEDEKKKYFDDLASTWGSWKFVDPKSKDRPTNIPYDEYPNKDLPRTAFPKGSWQTDTSYLKEFLQEGINLAERSMEAMLGEYGNSVRDRPNDSFEDRSWMFNLTVMTPTAECKNKDMYKKKLGHSGCITDAALADLQRYILHAIMTEDTFTIVMGGHSSAAGHGNFFKQSYTLQLQKALEPIFARLGVYHKSHNYGMGGLGTIQNALGARDIYGDEIDLLIWDSGMTEGDKPSQDLFARQGLISGKRVPVLLGQESAFGYYKKAGVGGGKIGYWEAAYAGIKEGATIEEIEDTIPYAAKYLNCDKELKNYCGGKKYNTTCWVYNQKRPDGFEPSKDYRGKTVGGRASWHPGNRQHQLDSRMIAFNVVRVVRDALKFWYSIPNQELPDDAWHVTDRYKKLRDGVLAFRNTTCYMFEKMPGSICDMPVHARTEFTPRHLPLETSIRSIMKPGGYIPETEENCYDPPDVYIAHEEGVPDGDVDYLSIIENGVPFVPNKARRSYVEQQIRSIEASKTKTLPPLTNPDVVKPGFGWWLEALAAPDNCDGTFNSFCNRGCKAECMLSGHNDDRARLLFDGYSGWLVVNLAEVKRGLIFAKLEDYVGPAKNARTDGWTCENNVDCPIVDNGRERTLSASVIDVERAQEDDMMTDEEDYHHQDHRRLKRRHAKAKTPPCEDFVFEFAIDGKVTSWSYDEWRNSIHKLQRVVFVNIFLDDPDYVPADKRETTGIDVELAMRLTGNCGRKRTFGLSHIYWA